MSARVIPLRRGVASATEPDYPAHTEGRSGAAPGPAPAAAEPPEQFKPRDLRWYVVETLAWVGAAAVLAIAVWLVRHWMHHPQEVSRWIT